VAILMPAVQSARGHAQGVASLNNLNQIGKAAQMYAMNNNEQRLPAADTWPHALTDMGAITDNVLLLPGRDAEGRGYAMNAAMGGVAMSRIRESSRTVLFFECAPGSPTAGGPELLETPPPFPGGYGIGFADGHVERVDPDDIGDLIWTLDTP
jgi:prepilin-type processing-associated H-X9-DG protein